MTKIWSWLVNIILGKINGAKTVIGTVGVILTFLIQTVVPFITTTFPSIGSLTVFVTVVAFLQKAFEALAAIGVVHKLDKLGKAVGV